MTKHVHSLEGCGVLHLVDAHLDKDKHYWLSSPLPSWRGGWRRVTCTGVGYKWAYFKEAGIERYRVARNSVDHAVAAMWGDQLKQRTTE